jgi:hypothetical protein
MNKRNTVSLFALSLGLRAAGVGRAFFQPAVLLTACVASASLLGACADENDPNTWVKRLDDPAQRTPAIKRLSQFFEDGMTKANKDRNNPDLKKLLDEIVEPMTKQYTAGNLDDKTRKELMKSLADMRDARTSPAIAKAFNEYEPGKNDEDVKYAAQAVSGLANAGMAIDPTVQDALWNVFTKFQVSKAKSINLVTDLHDAVLAVKAPSYGPKAVERINRVVPSDPKDTTAQMDEIQFWQKTSIQVIRDTKYTPGVKPLVRVLLTPEKKDLWALVESTLMHMPKEAEPVLIAALNGTDPDLAKQAALFGEDKTYIAVMCDALGSISRPAGHAAVLAVAGTDLSDDNKKAVAVSLAKFPSDPKSTAAFIALYNKVPGTTAEGLASRGALAQASVQLYDPSMFDFLLKEIAAAKGDNATSLQLPALDTAIKLSNAQNQSRLNDVVGKLSAFLTKEGSQPERASIGYEKALNDAAAAESQKCNADAACYEAVLDEPIDSGKPSANVRAIKAAYAVALIPGANRADLAKRVEKVKNPGARLALVEAIDHLAPQGDNAIAAQLEKIVETDKSSGDRNLLSADDAVVKVALRLRARALP